MKTPSEMTKLSEGFSKLAREEREERLIQMGVLTREDVNILKKEGALNFDLANHFVENVIGYFPLPLGVALNFVINGIDYIIPMAVEETSVIAGLSKAAKWIRDNGEITTQSLGHLGIGQIQIPIIKNLEALKQTILINKQEFIDQAHQHVMQDIFSRGGGIRDIVVRAIKRPDGKTMAVVHVLVDTKDAMGANTINQVCEFLKNPIESLTSETVGLCILSNLADTRLTQAKVVIRNLDPELGQAIAEASLFAQLDPYRAATNNKGAMNGIDAVLIATGNDWRAVEAGVHAYAAHTGQYTSITKWFMQKGELHGVFEAPILVGTVGGVTRLHPVAKICLRMLNVKSGTELSGVLAAVGLVQNLAALKALATEGITKGHMKLHLSNLAMASGASQEQLPLLKQRLIERLDKNKRITETDVKEILSELKKGK